MKIKYIDKKFSKSSKQIIETANAILDEYDQQGYDLTLRQLYYQFVARDLIPNTQKSYKRLGNIINDARLAGKISWYSIVDRTRTLRGLTHNESPSEAIDEALKDYQIDMWSDQRYHVEVWVEKDALIGVIEKACTEYDVNFFSCRGYSSQSEMWRAARRLQVYYSENKIPVILHLSDHDPSGMDMARDIQDRLRLFGTRLDYKRLALTMDQVEEYTPPPNPAKLSDTRANGYIIEFGNESWELDRLEPAVIKDLIQENIIKYIDWDLWESRQEEMDDNREALRKIVDNWEDVFDYTKGL